MAEQWCQVWGIAWVAHSHIESLLWDIVPAPALLRDKQKIPSDALWLILGAEQEVPQGKATTKWGKESGLWIPSLNSIAFLATSVCEDPM